MPKEDRAAGRAGRASPAPGRGAGWTATLWHTTQLLGALLATNAGPLILVSGSLATLLWRERCTARGVHISAAGFAAIGTGGVPLLLAAAWAALLLTS